MKLDLCPCSLVLISDVKAHDSPCVSFSLTGSMEVETIKEAYSASIQLTEIHMKKEICQDRIPLFSDVILPFSLSASANVNLFYNEYSFSMSCTPITLVVGSMDVAYLLTLIDCMKEWLPRHDTDTPPDALERSSVDVAVLDKSSSVEAATMDKSSSVDVAALDTSSSVEAATMDKSSSMEATPKTSVRLQLKGSLPTIRLIFTSNSYQSLIPVASVEVQHAAFSLHLQQKSLNVLSRITLFGQYFDRSSGKWLVAIEPCEINARMDQSVYDGDDNTRLDVKVDADSLLEVNVTASMVAALNTYFLEMKEAVEYHGQETLDLRNVAPRQKETVTTYCKMGNVTNNNHICFVNHSGLNILCCILDGYDASQTLVSFVVKDGEATYSDILSYPSFRQLFREDYVETNQKAVSVHCDGYNSVCLPLYSEATRYLVPQSCVDPRLLLVVRSQLSFGRKELLITGRISVENHSGLSLFYGFDSEATADGRGFLTPLERFNDDCVVYAPSSCNTNGVVSLSLGPSFSMYEHNAVARIIVDRIEGRDTAFVITLGRQQQCLRVHVTHTPLTLENGLTTSLIHIILLPCLVIRNQLPMALSVSISDVQNTRGRCWNGHTCRL